jgi:hypothetical protein
MHFPFSFYPDVQNGRGRKPHNSWGYFLSSVIVFGSPISLVRLALFKSRRIISGAAGPRVSVHLVRLNGVGTGALICCTAGISASRSSRFSSGRCAGGTSYSRLCKSERARERE